MKFNNDKLVELVKKDFKIDFYGDHGIEHWLRVYKNTKILAEYYKVESSVFELFSLLHDSKRENEFFDEKHGPRAAAFAKQLINEKLIVLNKEDERRLLFACANHTVTDKESLLCQDLIVQICFDSDRLDIGRVGITPSAEYMSTDYAKELTKNKGY